MPITKLDDVAALVVIDLQKGIVASPTVHPAGEIIGRVARLAHAFRNRELPVVLVNVMARRRAERMQVRARRKSRVRRIGPNLFRNWNRNPEIIW